MNPLDESRTTFGPTKTYQSRQVGIPGFLVELLVEHLITVPDDPDALVFTSPDGKPLSNSNFRNRVWLPALDAAVLQRGVVTRWAAARSTPG